MKSKQVEMTEMASENMRIKDKLLQVHSKKAEERLVESEKERARLQEIVDGLEDELAKKEDKLIDIKQRLFDLETKSEDDQILQQRIQQLEATVTRYKGQFEELSADLQRNNQELQGAVMERSRLEGQLDEANRRIESLTTRLSAGEAELEREISRNAEAVAVKKLEIQQLVARKSVTQEGYQKVLEFQEKLEKTIDENSQILKEKNHVIHIKDLEIEEFKRDKESLETDLERKTLKGKELKRRVAELEGVQEQLQNELAELTLKSSELLNGANQRFAKSTEELKTTLASVQADLARVREEVRTKNAQVKQLRMEKEELESKVTGLEMRQSSTIPNTDGEKYRAAIAQHLKRIDEYERKMVDQENKIDELETKIEQFEEAGTSGGSEEVQSLRKKCQANEALIKFLQKRAETAAQEKAAELEMLRRENMELNRRAESANRGPMNHSERITVGKFEEKNQEINRLKKEREIQEVSLVMLRKELEEARQKATAVEEERVSLPGGQTNSGVEGNHKPSAIATAGEADGAR
jgi:chromosome segregation ATPase